MCSLLLNNLYLNHRLYNLHLNLRLKPSPVKPPPSDVALLPAWIRSPPVTCFSDHSLPLTTTATNVDPEPSPTPDSDHSPSLTAVSQPSLVADNKSPCSSCVEPSDEGITMENGHAAMANETSVNEDMDSYAPRAAQTVGPNIPVNSVRPEQNELPNRPCSAVFTPRDFTPAHAIFEALDRLDMPLDSIKCLQRRQNGEVLITFKTQKLNETFVRQSTLTVDNETSTIQDVDKPLVYVTIFDAPHEMSDLILIERISEYCEVISSRRGRFSFRQNVFNGLHHFRVWLLRPIPSFLRFGRLQVRVKNDGQKPTCLRCGETDHFASACNWTVCFNCEELGHEMGQCPRRKRCCICRQEGHIGKYCQLSWARHTIVTETTDETEDVIVDNQSENSLAAEELALGAAIADRFNVEDVVVAGDQSFEGISDLSDNSSVLSSDDPTPVFDATPEPEVMPSQQYTVINVIPDPVLSKQQSAFSSQNTEITLKKPPKLHPLLLPPCCPYKHYKISYSYSNRTHFCYF